MPIEVKSGIKKAAPLGLKKFCELYSPKRALLIGEQSILLEEFLQTTLINWFD